MARGLSTRSHAVAVAALVSIGMTAARALEDPTRPPAGLARDAMSRRPASPLVLQSVIISDAGRAALINGELVQVGGRVGSARLIKVGEAEVELLIGSERRTLALFPGVEKRGVRSGDHGRGSDGQGDDGGGR